MIGAILIEINQSSELIMTRRGKVWQVTQRMANRQNNKKITMKSQVIPMVCH
jgi:hypothetical protein